MTSSHMGRRYIEEAEGRLHLVRAAVDHGLWSTAVREAQESVELFLKGSLRLMAVEPSRVHDVADLLRREAGRFPAWFGAQLEYLATISTELAGDRGIAFYGDERQELGPQDLFDEDDARRALQNAEFVRQTCTRLLAENAPDKDADPGN